MATPFFINPPRQITASNIGAGVTSLNGLQGNIMLGVIPGSGLYIDPSGSELNIGFTGETGTGFLSTTGGILTGNLQFFPSTVGDYGLRLFVNTSGTLPVNGVEGSLIYDNSTGVRVNDGTTWQTVPTLAQNSATFLNLNGLNGPITGNLAISGNLSVTGSTTLSGLNAGASNFAGSVTTSSGIITTTLAASGIISANNGLQIAANKSLYLGTSTADPTGTNVGQMYYNTTTQQIRIYTSTGWSALTGSGSISGSSGTIGYIAIWSSGTSLGVSALSQSGGNIVLNSDPTTSAGASLIEIGSNGFAGGGTNFTGSTQGTYLGINSPSGFTGNFIDFQSGGVSQISVSNTGNLISNKINNLTLAARSSGFAITGGTTPYTFALSGANITLNATTGASVNIPTSGTLLTSTPSSGQSIIGAGSSVPLSIQSGTGDALDVYGSGQTIGVSTPIVSIGTSGNLILSPLSGNYGLRIGNIPTASLPTAVTGNIGALVWDSTAGVLKVSTGSNWSPVSMGSSIIGSQYALSAFSSTNSITNIPFGSSGQVLSSNGLSGYPQWVTPTQMVSGEIVGGAINGSNTTFTIANTPITGSVSLYYDGAYLTPGSSYDYTISGSNIALYFVPVTGTIITASYLYGGIVTIIGGSSGSSGSGNGTVTSVGLSLPSIFSVSGSPVTTTGTLTATLATKTANTVLAGPVSGSAVAPAFRSLVVADIPGLPSAPRIVYVTSSSTITINVGTTDQYEILALAVSATIGITGTPIDGQKLMVRILDDGTAQTITWSSAFQSSGVATLLSTTVTGKTHMSGFIYDSYKAKYILMSVDSVGY